MNIIYLVTTRAGGEINKTFNNKDQAIKYYNDNIKYNAIITELHEFNYDNEIYYYSVENCLAIYNIKCEFVCKLKLNVNNFTTKDIISNLNNYFKNWIPVF